MPPLQFNLIEVFRYGPFLGLQQRFKQSLWLPQCEISTLLYLATRFKIEWQQIWDLRSWFNKLYQPDPKQAWFLYHNYEAGCQKPWHNMFWCSSEECCVSATSRAFLKSGLFVSLRLHKVVHAFIFSCLDYPNALYSSFSQSSLNNLQLFRTRLPKF